MEKPKTKSIDVTKYEDQPMTIRIKSSARRWQRTRVCAMLIKERVYKTFKKIAKAIQVTSSLNEHIQKYAGKNLPSTFVVRCNFTPVDQTGYKIRITHG